ncbi:MAG TPA: DNA polymerase III subunit gamma/tau [Polyangia bacterium]|jgi:DNA polymerase-3 subunit gamma/tau
MSYLVLARKYRPQRFTELVGQEHVGRTLTNAIAQNRVHHAFLFTGARGVGKTSAARILAKALSCVKGPTAEPCGVCEACLEIAAGNSVDIVEIDGASNTGVDDVRTLREGVRYLPSKGRLKIYIIDEVHMLSTSAFNALLKTLEEPPAHVVFIFATTEAHKIPTTILSRCQRYDFKLIPTARLVTHLEGILKSEGIAFEPDGLRLLARQAAGSVRDGLSLLDQVIAYVGDATISRDVVSEVLGVADRSLLVDLARHVLRRDVAATLRLLAAAVERGLDLGQLARAFLGLLRDLEVVARIGGAELGDLVDATPEEIEEMRALATAAIGEATPGAAGDSDRVAVLFDRWARAVEEAGKASNPRLILEMAAVDLCQAEPLEPLGDLLDRLEALEGRLGSSGGGGLPSGGGRAPARALTEPPARASAPPASSTTGIPAPSPPSIREAAPVRAVAPSAAIVPRPEPASAPPVVSSPPLPVAPAEAWRRARSAIEQRRPRIGALLANANVLELDATKLVLGFVDRADVESAEKNRADIEQALVTEFGGPVRLVAKHDAAAATSAVVRAETIQEADALAIDKRKREQEARQHPMIQKAQDLFGAAIREIKT